MLGRWQPSNKADATMWARFVIVTTGSSFKHMSARWTFEHQAPQKSDQENPNRKKQQSPIDGAALCRGEQEKDKGGEEDKRERHYSQK